MKEIRFLLYFSLFFVVLYLEPIPLGPITFSQLWKIPLLLYLMINVFFIGKRKRIPLFVKFSYARASKNLLNGGTLVSPIADISSFVRYMMFPLIYEFVSRKVKSLSHLNTIITSLAQFVILSGIPFLTKILEPLGREAGYDGIGDEFIGVFQTPHAASATLAISVLILIANLKVDEKTFIKKIFNIVLISIGLYALYLTFVRTGYLMFIVGLFVLFIPRKLTPRQIFNLIIIFGVLILGFFYLLEHNEIFYNRIFDIRRGQETSVGSGRFTFWLGAFDLWVNGDFFQLLFGHGMDGLKDRLLQIVGLRILAHNEFFTELAVNGLIGVSILFFYLFNLLKFIRRRKFVSTYRLALATYFLYFSLMATQGGMIFPIEVLMAIVFVKLEMENRAMMQFKNDYNTVGNKEFVRHKNIIGLIETEMSINKQ